METLGRKLDKVGAELDCNIHVNQIANHVIFFLTVLLKPSQDRLATVGTPAATTLLVLYQAYIDLNIDIYIY